MSFFEYLASKAVTLCFLIIGGFLMGGVFIAAKVSVALLGMTAAVYLVIILFWIIAGCRIERKKVSKLEKILEELPEKYLLGEVLPLPVNAVEKRYYWIMKEVSRSAIGAAEAARREKEEYCDYVERWIHEIKTPLTACALILANKGDMRKIRRELKRADNLTENILYYARMRTAEKDTQIKEFQVADVVETAVKSQMELLIAAKISVETEGDFTVHSDSKALTFILKQLLINCGKYCPGCHIDIRAEQGVITVEDNGIGIPSHELGRVTERGFTGSNGRKLGGSTGMGLYIVHELCGRLGISLKIESVQGAFTRVILSFESLTKM